MTRAIDHQGLLLPRRKERVDQVVSRRLRGLTLVLEQVHDPHNLAAVLRTAEGFGLQDVHVVEAPGGFRPNAAVTQGADKWIDVHKHRDSVSCAAALRGQGFALYGSRLEGEAVDVEALPFAQDGKKLALIFGNEHEGLSARLASACEGFFKIPMLGFAQSFNVSVAVGITLSTAVLARRRLGLGGDLNPEEQEALRRRFYALAVKQGARL